MLSPLLIAATLSSAFALHEPEKPVGPVLGAVGPTSARLWYRPSEPGDLSLFVMNPTGEIVAVSEATASPDHDLVAHFEISGLSPGVKYTYVVRRNEQVLAGPDGCTLTAAPPLDQPCRVNIAFGSCANHQTFPQQPVWTTIGGGVHHDGAPSNDPADVIVLLGDTPYIDSTDLAVQRTRYREFFSLSDAAPLFRCTPQYATWDDHDFGANDTSGDIKGKDNSRKAFTEYHAGGVYGDGANPGHGIYSSFRYGPVEVFLIDARWFSGTEKSLADPERPTLLGGKQWEWLQQKLARSTATFKVLATGMIWNEAVRPNKPDHWMAYPAERKALLDFIAENKIPGVVLMGGDIHRSRALKHPTSETGVSYELWEFIASPLAQKVMASAKVDHPALVHDVGEEHSFIMLTADTTTTPATLTATCYASDGRELFKVELKEDAMRPHASTKTNKAGPDESEPALRR